MKRLSRARGVACLAARGLLCRGRPGYSLSFLAARKNGLGCDRIEKYTLQYSRSETAGRQCNPLAETINCRCEAISGEKLCTFCFGLAFHLYWVLVALRFLHVPIICYRREVLRALLDQTFLNCCIFSVFI